MKSTIRRTGALAGTAVLFISLAVPLMAHHSFAMYDTAPEARKTLTGTLERFVIGANHSQFVMNVLNPNGTPKLDEKTGKPETWTIETTAASQLARQNITVDTFKYGTVFTVTFSPLRDGRNGGAQQGAGLIMCGMKMPEGGCNEKTGKRY